VKFYFIWENPLDRWDVVNLETHLMLNGYEWMNIDGGFAPPRESDI
jgi:hypothetical protein